VRHELKQRGLALSGILITHWHPDHIGGLASLSKEFQIPVYGPAAEAARIPGLTHALRESDRVNVLDLDLTVWEVPGHTLGHIACVGKDFVLCGDTLFSAGCGRLFEGTAEMMHRSLSRFLSLPDHTLVYCTHEYTLANLAFAITVEPESKTVQDEIARVRQLRTQNRPSLPTRIGHERRINPFLRADAPAVAQAAVRHAGHELDSPMAVFAALRLWKDGFRTPPGF
ncbi:MAG: hydroxyacylglutathione hydrolase, partial [Hydrocarboniphaga effusa]|nr:hydroxyacylglutathione hydrolase [Hydrocarboniphaga effusa]